MTNANIVQLYKDKLKEKPVIPIGDIAALYDQGVEVGNKLRNVLSYYNDNGFSWRGSQLELNQNNTLPGYGGYIDFHYNGSTAGYTSRIIEDASGKLNIYATNGLFLNGSALEYRIGDSITFGRCVFAGHLTTSATEIQISIVIPKPVASGVTNVTFTSFGGNIRLGNGGYAAAQGTGYVGGNGFNYLPYYSWSGFGSENMLFVVLSFPNVQGSVNNVPITFQSGAVTLTFR